MTATPPPGPLDARPAATNRQAAEMLDQALAGLPLGAWDQRIRERVLANDPAYVATVASWLRAAWDRGLEDGRTERREEKSGRD